MRRTVQLRFAALLGALIALAFALLLAFIVFLLLGRDGKLGFQSFNAKGLLEGVTFIVAYSVGLLYARWALRIPSPTLLSFGLSAPPSAGRVAEKVPVVNAGQDLHTLMENRVVIVEEGGVPVGMTGLRPSRMSSWDELVKVNSHVAVTELRFLLAHEALVVVMEDKKPVGVITQEMYLSGLWGRLKA